MDPAVIAKGVPELLDKGLLGLAVVAMAGALIWVVRHALGLQKQLVETQASHARELKELALKTAEGLSSSSVTAAAQATAIDRSNMLLQQILDLVRSTPGQHDLLAKLLERCYDKMEQVIDILRNERGSRS